MRALFFLVLVVSGFVRGQSPAPVVTAFPSLRIPASSRGLSMGDAGIASAVDNQSLYYNASKIAFAQNFHQASISYMPWLVGISDDTRFVNLNYVGNVSNSSAVGASINYLNMGSLVTRDNNGAAIASHNAREFNIGLSYALQIGANASFAGSFKFLGQNVFEEGSKNSYGICGDLSYYQFVELGDVNRRLEWGAVVSNVGPKIGYMSSVDKTSLPLNLGVGVGYSAVDEEGSLFSAGLDLNKLLVPSSASLDKGILAGMVASFSEPRQLGLLRVNSGIEYGYLGEFYLRGGVSLENKTRGNRTFFGLGVGYKGLVLDQSWGIDFHYLVPFGMVAAVSPFSNSFGFSLRVNFGNFQ